MTAAWAQPVQLLAVKTAVYAAVDRAVVQYQFADTGLTKRPSCWSMPFSYPAISNQRCNRPRTLGGLQFARKQSNSCGRPGGGALRILPAPAQAGAGVAFNKVFAHLRRACPNHPPCSRSMLHQLVDGFRADQGSAPNTFECHGAASRKLP